MKTLPETRTLLALSLVKGVGPAALKSVLDIPNLADCPIDVVRASVPRIDSVLGKGDEVWNEALMDADTQIDVAASVGARIISTFDAEYPPLLRASKDDPVILYVRGNLAPAVKRSAAVVGTREPTRHGSIVTERITRFYVENGWSVISGLALGCDSIAHRAALDERGHTVAVLAHGLHTVAPTQNRRLAEDIVNGGGALVSQYPFGRAAERSQFVARDRIQAGLAQGVVMIQSDLKGGSLHASRAALEYGRWLAVPYPTERDIDEGEPKVQANLVLAEGSEDDMSKLLRCSASAADRVMILRSKEDYSQLLGEAGSSYESVASGQGRLL